MNDVCLSVLEEMDLCVYRTSLLPVSVQDRNMSRIAGKMDHGRLMGPNTEVAFFSLLSFHLFLVGRQLGLSSTTLSSSRKFPLRCCSYSYSGNRRHLFFVFAL